MSQTPTQTQDAIFLLADISGYTKFMVQNQTSLEHAQFVIRELFQTLLKKVQKPLMLVEIEGDALFLCAFRNSDELSWNHLRTDLGISVINFLNAFSQKIDELRQSNLCSCTMCMNIEILRLKIIIHKGIALQYRLGRFMKVAGLDVITAHRLLKNSVMGHEYILMTQPAYDFIQFSMPLFIQEHMEEYEHIGTIKTFVYQLDPISELHPLITQYSSFFYKLKNTFLKMVFPLLARSRLLKIPELRKGN